MDQAKLAGALLGGYLLGRTKKGGFALRLATRMAVSGTGQQPTELVRDNLSRLLGSGILDQLRDQAMEAAKAAVDARVQGLASNLDNRTAALKDKSGAAQGTADKVTSTVFADDEDQSEDQGEESEDKGEPEEKPKRKPKKKPEPEPEPEPEDEEEEEEPEDEEPEDEDEEPEPEDEEDEEDEQDEPEEEDEDESDEDLEQRITDRAHELRRKRIHTLRNMAMDLGFEEEDVADEEDKSVLTRWIAEAEVEDEDEEEEE
jgi:hypothetical protein